MLCYAAELELGYHAINPLAVPKSIILYPLYETALLTDAEAEVLLDLVTCAFGEESDLKYIPPHEHTPANYSTGRHCPVSGLAVCVHCMSCEVWKQHFLVPLCLAVPSTPLHAIPCDYMSQRRGAALGRSYKPCTESAQG